MYWSLAYWEAQSLFPPSWERICELSIGPFLRINDSPVFGIREFTHVAAFDIMELALQHPRFPPLTVGRKPHFPEQGRFHRSPESK